MAVAAIKLGAFDFIEKPFDEARSARQRSQRDSRRGAAARDGTAGHREDCRPASTACRPASARSWSLPLPGLSNKEIGAQLNISPKTVENHRAWVMERIGARNIAELVRMAMKS